MHAAERVSREELPVDRLPSRCSMVAAPARGGAPRRTPSEFEIGSDPCHRRSAAPHTPKASSAFAEVRGVEARTVLNSIAGSRHLASKLTTTQSTLPLGRPLSGAERRDARGLHLRPCVIAHFARWSLRDVGIRAHAILSGVECSAAAATWCHREEATSCSHELHMVVHASRLDAMQHGTSNAPVAWQLRVKGVGPDIVLETQASPLCCLPTFAPAPRPAPPPSPAADPP